MATAGRKPKPTALKLLQGTFQPCRANPAEPKLQAERLPAPAHLNEHDRKVWEQISGQLADAGILTKLDAMELEALCLAWSEFLYATGRARQEGMVITVGKKYPMISPWITVANQAFKKVHNLLTDLGMSPSSRARIKASEPAAKEKDGWAEL